MKLSSCGAVVTVALLMVGSFAQAGDAPATIGWRQNWNGLFPDATPPTAWSRTPKGLVQDMRCATTKPSAATDGTSMGDGFISEYLITAGPLADETAAAPTSGDTDWKKQVVKRASCSKDGDWNSYGGPDWLVLNGYAFVYLYAKQDGTVSMLLDHCKDAKVLLNGKTVYENAKPSVSWVYTGNLSQHRLANYAWPKAQRLNLALKKGWNSVLIKASGPIHPWLIDPPTMEYEQRNIAWVTALPGEGNGGAFVVGDRIFTMIEPDELVCLSKADGKILWRASNNHFDATPPEERTHENFAKIEKINKEKLEATGDKREELAKQVYDLLVQVDPKKYAMNLNDHAQVHFAINGFSTPTPCSDGKFVYVWCGNGVAACYDMGGKRQWITRIDEFVKDPKSNTGPYGYPCSPVLVGGKFIISLGEYFALDAKTGKLAWRSDKIAGSMTGMVPAMFGGQEAILSHRGSVMRVSDGAALWKKYDAVPCNHWSVPVVAGETFYTPLVGGYDLAVVDFSGAANLAPSSAPATAASAPASAPAPLEPRVGRIETEQGWKGDINIASAPLYHDGIVYEICLTGSVYAIDVKTNRLLYKQQLDLRPFIHGNAVGCAAPLTLACKYIYAFDNQGNCVIFEPGPTFKQVARNTIRNAIQRPYPINMQENCTYSNPVFEGKRMYLRAERHVYCIGSGDRQPDTGNR